MSQDRDRNEEAHDAARRQANIAAVERFAERCPWPINDPASEEMEEIAALPWRNKLAGIICPSPGSFDQEIGKGTLANFFQPNHNGATQELGIAGVFRFQGAVIGVYAKPERPGQRELERDRGYRH